MWFRTLFDSMKRASPLPPGQPAGRGAPRRRPAACRLAVEALEDRCVPASLSVSDVVFVEGYDGASYFAVTVSLDAPSTKTVRVSYNTADGTATAGSDYDAVSGKLTFARGETSKSILVPVRGDRLAETDEFFFVNLNRAQNATIADGQGGVTILDYLPRLGISGAYVSEGDFGTTLMTFTVSLEAHDETVTVNFATQDGWREGWSNDAIAGQDYVATSGTLTFAPGETTKTITVEIIGDATPEYDEWFSVILSGASANALINFGQGFGTILDDYGTPGWYNPDANTYS